MANKKKVVNLAHPNWRAKINKQILSAAKTGGSAPVSDLWEYIDLLESVVETRFEIKRAMKSEDWGFKRE